MNKEVKLKKCKVCRSEFKPYRTTQRVCGVKCSCKLARDAENKKIAKRTREQKERLKTRSEWIRDAQKVVNQYVRVRDAGKPCISCGRHHQGQYHAGHYRTTAAASGLRFYTLNISRQCMPCNTHKSGNVVEYRINLVKKYGIDVVEYLESQNEPVRYEINWLKRLIIIFRKKIKLYNRLFRNRN